MSRPRTRESQTGGSTSNWRNENSAYDVGFGRRILCSEIIVILLNNLQSSGRRPHIRAPKTPDATLANLLGFGSNRNLLGAKFLPPLPVSAWVLRAGVTGRTGAASIKTNNRPTEQAPKQDPYALFSAAELRGTTTK